MREKELNHPACQSVLMTTTALEPHSTVYMYVTIRIFSRKYIFPLRETGEAERKKEDCAEESAACGSSL